MAGHMKYLLNCNSSVVQAQVELLFCESLYSLGRVNVDVMTFDGCLFKWDCLIQLLSCLMLFFQARRMSTSMGASCSTRLILQTASL